MTEWKYDFEMCDISEEKVLLGLQNRISFYQENVMESELDYPLSMVGPKYEFLW